MALVSKFYDGPVTETDRATNRAGAADYGVIGAEDFKVSTHPSIPYALNVAAGKAHGYGVSDTAEAAQVVQCETLSGGVRFDLIVVRRNWQPLLGGPSTLVAIQGGSTIPNIQTLRTIGPGVEDDQPIALVEWRGNVNAPYRIIDLRCWAGNGGVVIADILARDYLARPGADVLLGITTWRYTLGANGVWDWVDPDGGTETVGFVQPTGWSLVGECRISQFTASLRRVEMDVNVVRTGANFAMPVNDFTSIGAVLSSRARGNSGAVKYVPIAISGGTLGNNKTAQGFLNTLTGQIGFRSNEDTWLWVTGAQTTFNVTYFI